MYIYIYIYIGTVLIQYSHFVCVFCLCNCAVPLYMCCFFNFNSRQLTREGGKVSPTHRPPLPLRKYPWYSFLAIVQKDYVKEKFQ